MNSCISCGRDFAEVGKVQTEGNPPKTSDDVSKGRASLLSGWEKVKIWLIMSFLGPIGWIYLSYKWHQIKKTDPNKASKFNKTCWIAWGTLFVLGFILKGLSTPPEASPSAQRQTTFHEYAQAVKNNFKSEEGSVLTIDEIGHRIICSVPAEYSSAGFDEEDWQGIRNYISNGIVNDTEMSNEEIEMIKQTNTTWVFRYITKDGKTIEVEIKPHEWKKSQ